MKLAASLALLAIATPPAHAQQAYALDDGAPNFGITYGTPADYAWLQSFTTTGGPDAIVKVRLMLEPGGIRPGTAIRLCVWEDPNDDLQPNDAVLRSVHADVVPSVANLRWVDYDLPAAGGVEGAFFLGALVETDGTFATIGLVDTDAPVAGRAWFATASPGQLDPERLGDAGPQRIEVLGAGIRGVFLLRGEGTGTAPRTYCEAKPNSLGCAPRIRAMGVASASAGTGFHVQATGLLNRGTGALLYSVRGRDAVPFAGGTMCLAGPLRRTPAMQSGGSAQAKDCSGVHSFDFAAWVASGADASLVAGTTVYAQYYTRDPGFPAPNNVGLSDALEFILVP
jgi:hypothetical protein